MAVGSFDPAAAGGPIDLDLVRMACAVAEREVGVAQERTDLELSAGEARRLAPLATHPGWAGVVGDLSEERLGQLIRLFTLGEMQIGGWTAGERSAVIAFVAELKRRGAYDASVTRWIKAHTDNRFLPHGSLKDRL